MAFSDPMSPYIFYCKFQGSPVELTSLRAEDRVITRTPPYSEYHLLV